MQAQRVCLLHYHELGLKGHNRSHFEHQLINNLKSALASEYPQAKVTSISGRELISCPDDVAAAAIARIAAAQPGVVKVSIGLQVARELEQINAAALRLCQENEPYHSFKVAARRANTDFPIDSMQLNQLVGDYLCEHLPQKQVKMKQPDLIVHVEVIQAAAYVFARQLPGVGGLPAGTAGKVVSLLSAGFDSPVATWRMQKRGACVYPLHFSGAPETPDTSTAQVTDIVKVLARHGGIKPLLSIPFGSYQRKIALESPEKLRIVLYRRLMFAVAEAYAQRIGAKALVCGESLGQVASQTLDNIAATSAVLQMPIFRPLIGNDKQEIINEAQALGTYGLSAAPAEDCCTLFMPRSPETHAKAAEVEREWAKFPVRQWVMAMLEPVH
ncbi:MAG: tRNA 4-thiouridine(8) synthase ThiI [Coriobacteriales bacterium]|jgi:thiamine biosynthesis protein ThiI|nr:tRNA 4-thiouridine(8) synthase ThiI [Coriobacteriales bacterium]